MTDKLIIFDTTLRDGEQSPGASMTREEKLRIARQLERLRVDVIEAGFAASSNGDFEAVRAIAEAVKDSTVCSLARANDRDISRSAEALKRAARSRIHTFIATSELHMEKKLRMTRDQVHEQARQAVRFARNLCGDIEFSPEDGYRSDPDFLCQVLETVIAEGATTINIPDTVGYAVPELYGEFIRNLRQRIPNSDKAIWSVHCHNDLGMAVANSLAGVKIGGARQIECTINGLGERAGNCSLEEVVMAAVSYTHLADGHPDRRVRQELHPGEPCWRSHPDVAPSTDQRTRDRGGGREAARHDALDQGQQAGRQESQLTAGRAHRRGSPRGGPS